MQGGSPVFDAFVSRTRGLFGWNGQETEQTTDDVSTTLFRCERCNRTYVSEAMDACSRCGDEVEAVPDETDLGLC